MAFEAFFGVIFAGITGAIIYGKITHIQTVAPVTFSNAVCVRYGTGVAAAQQVEEDEVNGEENKELPFPLLEFRLVNEMSSFSGGEIIDASLAVVATVPVTDDDEGGMIMDEEDQKEKRKPSVLEAGKNVTKGIGEAGKTVTKGIGKATKKSLDASKKVGTAGVNVTKGVGKGVGTAGKNVAQGVGSVVSQMHRHLLRSKRSKKAGSATASGAATPEGSETTDTASVIDEKELEAALEKAFEAKFVEKLEKEREKVAPAITMQQSYIVVDEGSSDLCPARRVHKLMIETDSHPFFKRSWMIRHVLDKSSPLWSPEARRMIERNNGDFPPELNNYEMIRKHLCYKELLVSLSGTSNSSGSTVFAHKVYYFEAVNVGYTFAPMLHSCPSSGKILVDRYLFNDVREQIGGGAEPLVVSDEDEGLVATGVGVAVGATMATAEGVTEGVAAVTAKTLEGVTAAANAVAQGGHQVMGTAMQRNNS